MSQGGPTCHSTARQPFKLLIVRTCSLGGATGLSSIHPLAEGNAYWPIRHSTGWFKQNSAHLCQPRTPHAVPTRMSHIFWCHAEHHETVGEGDIASCDIASFFRSELRTGATNIGENLSPAITGLQKRHQWSGVSLRRYLYF